MDFITKIHIPSVADSFRISYTDSIISIGSCFASHLQERLDYYKFPSFKNPFGTLFHPLSIEKSLQRTCLEQPFTEADFFLQDDLWLSFDLHSQWASSSLPTLLSQLNTSLIDFSKALTEASFLIITLGTAWVYEHLPTGTIVANCHKQPQIIFKKHLLSLSKIRASLKHIVQLVQEKQPNIKIIFTVSPVRHLKDGAQENLLSKSLLICAIHELLGTGGKNKSGNLLYFPSYEILMDELRDYRFYKEDMLHPNEQAIQYIWERFAETFFTSSTQSLMQEVANIQRALAHRPFNPEGEKYRQFQANLQQKIKVLQEKYPYLMINDKFPKTTKGDNE